MKQINRIQVYDFSRHMNYVLIFVLPMWLHCWANLNFPYTFNGKSGNSIYFCVTLDILMNIVEKCSLDSPLPTTCILSKLLIS